MAAFALLGGCASLSKDECRSASWVDIGIRDGADGRPEEYLIHHTTACARVGVQPDREAWLAGRERGLERFCVPQRAFRIGEYGGGFESALCLGYDEDRLIEAYEKGRDVYRTAGALSEIDTQIQSVRAMLARDDLDREERESLAFRLGQLAYARDDAERAHERARYRARNL